MKLLLILLSLVSISSFGQEYLDLEKNRDCELFVIKKGYDVKQRVNKIKELVGKTVTVYHVSGKKNKIKLSYTGSVKMTDYPKITDKDRASLITVKTVNINGQIRLFFPLTNDKRFRIYLSSEMK